MVRSLYIIYSLVNLLMLCKLSSDGVGGRNAVRFCGHVSQRERERDGLILFAYLITDDTAAIWRFNSQEM